MFSAQAKKSENILNIEIRGVRDRLPRCSWEATWAPETLLRSRNANTYRIADQMKLS